MIQWTTLNWTQVHQGVLPLWNPYSGLGLPLAFNWQSASFGVPSLVGYLFPLRYAYTAGVVATLMIAGSGAYVLGRVLRLGLLGALFVTTVFELSGPLIAWLGYPQGQVMSWGGWLLAAGLLVVRGHRPLPSITLFAAVLAAAIYSGHPETLIVMVGATAIFFVVLLWFRAFPTRLGLESGPIRKPTARLVAATAGGCALGAPLLLPALQLTASSVRATVVGRAALPVHDLLYVLFSGFDGVPVTGNYGFGAAYYYNEVSAYVGIIVIVLAVVGVVGTTRRRPEVLALVAVVVVTVAFVYVAPVDQFADGLPFIGEVDWLRALMPLSLALAALAGIGMDAFTGTTVSRTARAWLFGGFGVSAVVLAALWVFGRNGGLPSFDRALGVHVRAESFLWPAVGVFIGVAGGALLWWKARFARAVAVALLVGETLFLVTSGAVQVASSANGYPPTTAVIALRHAVGDAIVGTGVGTVSGCSLGITPEANVAYQVHELTVYDPILPTEYSRVWKLESGSSEQNWGQDHFCPSITTLSEARLFGAGYVLETAGHPGPAGSQLVAELKPSDPYPVHDVLQARPPDEDLYRIPGASQATLTVTSSRSLPSLGAGGTPVRVIDTDPARWRLVTNSTTAEVLRLHLTDVPGWQATIDGRPLALEGLSGIMFQARIPPGRHVIELHYWPIAFTVGLVLAVGTVLVLISALLVDHLVRRRRH
jgi:hypothetical protein